MLAFNSIRRVITSYTQNINYGSTFIGFVRFESKRNNNLSNSSNSEESEDSSHNDKSTTTTKIKVTNTRVDLIIKSGLGIARNKIEKLFYENKIRVNGQKIVKKSEQVEEGDEIDVIKGPSPMNPEFLVVARVEVLSMKPEEDAISMKIRRCRSLLVENKRY